MSNGVNRMVVWPVIVVILFFFLIRYNVQKDVFESPSDTSLNTIKPDHIEQKLTVKLTPEPQKKIRPKNSAKKPLKAEETSETIGKYLSTSLDYRRTLGFNEYWKFILRNGGRFFLYDRSRQRIVAEIDLETESFRIPGNLNSFSSRSRIVTGEPTTDRLEANGRNNFGPGSYQVIFLFPESLEVQLQARIKSELSKSDIELSDIVELKGQYERTGHDVQIVFDKAILKGGQTKHLKFAIGV